MNKIARSLFFSSLVALLSLSAFAQLERVEEAPTKIPTTIAAGVVNGKAVNLVKPAYPPAAKAVRASGSVNVQVLIDEEGNLVSATATSGHPLLRAAAAEAARASKFSPTTLSGQPVKVNGVIVYNFVLPSVEWKKAGFALGDAETEITDDRQLFWVANDLSSEFPDESRELNKIAEKFSEGEEQDSNQFAAVNGVINSLKSKLSAQPVDLWTFEIGLAKGRIKASYFDETVLRAVLPKFKELAQVSPEGTPEDTLKALEKLGELSNKSTFTRKDKKEIERLLNEL